MSLFPPWRGHHGARPVVHQGGELTHVGHPCTLQGAFFCGREQGDHGQVVALGRVNEAQGIVGTAIALGAEVRVSDGKRPVEHAQDVGVWRGEQALDIIVEQGEVEGLQGGGRPGLLTGHNRPAHGGHRDRRACQGVLQQPGIKRHLETEADRGAAAGLDIDDGDVQGLISAADHVEHVGNALAVYRTDTARSASPGNRAPAPRAGCVWCRCTPARSGGASRSRWPPQRAGPRQRARRRCPLPPGAGRALPGVTP